MAAWRERRLGDVCELKRGYDLPASARERGSIPIVSSSGISGYHAEAKVRGPGVVTGRYGTLGQVFFVDEDFWPLNTALYVRDFKGNDPRFVAALLESMQLGRNEGAAAVPGVNRNHLHELRVACPELPVQQQVSSILAVLGGLIENNRRRIDLLEQMAEAIYREWFVRFRYPGRGESARVAADHAVLPAGWAIRPLSEIADIVMGQSPSSEHYNDEQLGTPFHQGVTDFGQHFPVNRKFCSVDGRRAQKADILVSVRAPVGRMNIALTDLVIGRGLAAIRSKSGRQASLYWALRTGPFAEEDAMGGGTIYKAINKNELASVPVLFPVGQVRDDAEAILSEQLALIRTLTLASRRLADLRTTLLPKLVTGQIDVSNLDLDALVEQVS